MAVLLACGGIGQPCPQVDCAISTVLTVTDSAGNPLTDFSGIVSNSQDRFAIGCGNAAAPDAGTMSADGGQLFLGRSSCEGNKVTLFVVTAPGDVRAELTSGNKSFNGVVTLVTESKPVGPLECNTSCPTQKGAVVLQ